MLFALQKTVPLRQIGSSNGRTYGENTGKKVRIEVRF
jgi:hypothetical protein